MGDDPVTKPSSTILVFLDLLNDGDVVMADRGFLIEGELKEKGATLQIPAFTKGRSQLNPIEIEDTRKIANVRILVERIIGQIRLKYPILKDRQFKTHTLARTSNDCNVSVIDQVVTVACAMVNFCTPIYSKEMGTVFEIK